MPAYVIAPNDTLTAIADVRPRTLSGLARVKGMGRARIEKYGDEILGVVEQVLKTGA